MSIPDLSLLAVFLTGLLGGVHCAGMCGGIVSALGMMRQRPLRPSINIPVTVAGSAAAIARQPQSALSAVLLYNVGRISTYVILGALAGGVGSIAWLMQSILPIQQVAFTLSNLLFIVMGLYVLGIKRIGAWAESLGHRLWLHIRPAATLRLQGRGALNSVLAGSLWGMVPCGMVYAVLSAALVSGNAQKGALLMLVFGLGTLPNLVALGLSGQWLARASRNRYVRIVAGSLIIVFGLAGFMRMSMFANKIESHRTVAQALANGSSGSVAYHALGLGSGMALTGSRGDAGSLSGG